MRFWTFRFHFGHRECSLPFFRRCWFWRWLLTLEGGAGRVQVRRSCCVWLGWLLMRRCCRWFFWLLRLSYWYIWDSCFSAEWITFWVVIVFNLVFIWISTFTFTFLNFSIVSWVCDKPYNQFISWLLFREILSPCIFWQTRSTGWTRNCWSRTSLFFRTRNKAEAVLLTCSNDSFSHSATKCSSTVSIKHSERCWWTVLHLRSHPCSTIT